MTVDPAHAAGRVEHDGRTYYFCSKGCAAKFQADPPRYLQRAARRTSHVAPGTSDRAPGASHAPGSSAPSLSYTCPMHPEVVSDRPGACPKCGMALEPRTGDATDAPNPELVDMT